jgi:hypothetical protein
LVGPLVFRRFISSEALPRRFIDDVVCSFLDEARPDRALSPGVTPGALEARTR